jgi:hypothetical protein
MTAKSISVHVLRPHYDSTNGGVTKTQDSFLLFASRADYDAYVANIAIPSPKELPALIVVRRNICGSDYVHCEPPTWPDNTCGPMSGGNYVITSDSRYREVTGVPYPISVHDRFETPELNAQNSR